MKETNKKYFLAANSGVGFISLFDSCYSAKDGWRVYIIKGGPGTGKSSFMKYMIKTAEEKKVDEEKIKDLDAQVYYAAVYQDENDDVRLTSSRALGVLAVRDTIEEAEIACEEAIKYCLENLI